jgi:hypothetical protein
MKTNALQKLILVLFFFVACNLKTKNKIVVSDVTYENIASTDSFVEPPPPPVLHFSQSLTLQDCFVKICQHEQPNPFDTTYRLGLYKISNSYVIFFIASNAYQKNAKEWVTKKGSDYLDKYYPVTLKEEKDSGWEYKIEEIRSALKEFSRTETFKTSSLAKVKSLKVIFDDAQVLLIK